MAPKMMKAAAGSILDTHLRRKSTAALLMTNELRRNSRVSTNSFEQTNYLLGPDGLSFYGINLVPFRNGFRYNPLVGNAAAPSSRKTSAFVAAAFHHHQQKRRGGNNQQKTSLQRFTDRLLSFYEKSRIHYLLPILILVIYSVLGGAIFYAIESPAEQSVLLRKKEYVAKEERHILAEVLNVDQKIKEMRYFYNISGLHDTGLLETYETYAGLTIMNREIRKYKNLAMNRIEKTIYWYVLLSYLLNNEKSKSSLLNPSNPEKLWKAHFQQTSAGEGIARIVALRNYTQQLAERCWELGFEGAEESQLRAKLRVSMDEFNKFVGLQNTLTPTWTIWNAMFLAVTTYSTIGYGNIVPKTSMGRLFAMIYAVIGIPMTFMILHKLGRFFLLCLEYIWHKLIWLMEFVSCVKDAEKLKGKVGQSGGMPVLLAIGVAFAWMFLCAAIFLQFEPDWDYFKSFYFFFCSLTTIGYGDVTPTNSEDMFIMFGFIIVGLSLLKLEELFEELLLTMMEEYGDTGQTVEEITAAMKPRLVDLWKMWKRRRQRRSMQCEDAASNMMPPPPTVLPPTIVAGHQSLLSDHPLGVPSARQPNWPNNFSESSLRRVIKLFPFGKMRREAIIRRLQLRFNQHSKATQTDFYCCTHGREHCFRYQPADMLLSYTTRELDEELAQETLTNNSSEVSIKVGGPQPPMNLNDERLTVSTGSPSNSSNQNNTKATASHSSSPATFNSSSSSSAYIRRYLPSNAHHQHQQIRRFTAHSAQTHCSVQSAPNGQPGSSSGLWEQLPAAAGGRRWTFYESSKTPRGAPRGLAAVPYMGTRKKAKKTETTEMRRLIAEIDSRLLDCRTLVSPCSRSVSRTSTATSPSIP